MRSLADRVLDIFRSKLPNTFWADGRLVGEESFILELMTRISIIHSQDNSPVILGVYLFGSLLALKNSPYYKVKPSDMDIYVFVSDYGNIEMNRFIRETFETTPNAFDLKVNAAVRDYHPFVAPSYEDFVDGPYIYPFYEDQRLPRDDVLRRIIKEEVIGKRVLEFI